MVLILIYVIAKYGKPLIKNRVENRLLKVNRPKMIFVDAT